MRKLYQTILLLLLSVLVYSQEIKTENDVLMNDTISLTDCQGHIYKAVKIGDQYWMAENMRCTQYDTESERHGELIYASDKPTYKPYYFDCRNKFTFYYSEDQIEKMGLLYNWAAAMGYGKKESKRKKGELNEQRQGICPNGWHIPSEAEVQDLCNSCGGWFIAGYKLKSPEIWSSYDECAKAGRDDYGFCAMPSGEASGNKSLNQGVVFNMLTTTGYKNNYLSVLGMYLYADKAARITSINRKNLACSVRCVKN